MSLTNSPARSSRVQRARPLGGLEQAVATSRFLLPRELAGRSGTRLFAQRRHQVAEHEAALGPVDSRAACADTGGDCFVARACVGSQQNLRSLARGVLAATQKRCEFARSVWLSSTR